MANVLDYIIGIIITPEKYPGNEWANKAKASSDRMSEILFELGEIGNLEDMPSFQNGYNYWFWFSRCKILYMNYLDELAFLEMFYIKFDLLTSEDTEIFFERVESSRKCMNLFIEIVDHTLEKFKNFIKLEE